MKNVTENIYAELISPGCNVGIISTPKGDVIVDTPILSRHAATITEALGAENRGSARYLIVTHPHGDHILGTGLFGEDVIVIGSRFTYEQMKKYESAEARAWAESWNWQNQDEVEEMANARIKLPEIIFEDELNLELGGLEIQILPLSGHQRNVTGVFVPKYRALFTGDALFNENHPYMAEGNFQVWLDSLEKMKALKPDFIVPGHGPVCGIETVSKQQSYMERMMKIAETWNPEAGEEAIPSDALDALLAYYPLHGRPEAYIKARMIESIRTAGNPKF